MEKDIRELLGKKRLICDGGMGSLLVKMGMKPGEAPEMMGMRSPEAIESVHRAYLDAGADIITTNTFGVNSLKYPNYVEYLEAAFASARAAVGEGDAYIAFDVGPTGRMLKPLGDLDFEDAVSTFADSIRHAERLGADLILIETMTDMYETKAAVLAARENSSLPIFVSNVYDESGKMMTGADPEAMVALLEGLGVSALGLNCSLGPEAALPVLRRLLSAASVPVIFNPNAGLPEVVGGETVYNVSPREYADTMARAAELGASIVGGCCGTTPEYISLLCERTAKIPYTPPTQKNKTVVSSYTHVLEIGTRPVIVGERINPTGKPKLKAALATGELSYVLSEALAEVDEGADALDVNFGLPNIDEVAMMRRGIYEIQSVTDVPLQVDSARAEVLEAAMRIYNGKPLVNSVTGSQESLRAVLPLVRKYGGVLIALTMDEEGIPEDAAGRVAIAERIMAAVRAAGIRECDVVFDPLCLTVASGDNNARVTIEAVRLLKARGYKCSLGVSNVSFGLPEREVINASFYTVALAAGLDLAIINPHSAMMMNAHRAYMALSGMDGGCADYVARVIKLGEDAGAAKQAARASVCTLGAAIERGFRDEARRLATEAIRSASALEVINGEIIPALDAVGVAFEEKRSYLPQLLSAAEAASAAFEVIKANTDSASDNGRTVVLATVKGDIHDIGKNIVKLLFESYGYRVIDLGRDVAAERVLEALAESGAELLGLSALMTTTVGAMRETVELVRAKLPRVKILVGGAVLTEELAKEIGADFYAPDAMSGVRAAAELSK